VQYFSSHGVEIECVEEVLPKSFENELVEDMLSLLSSFSSRIYGKRSADRRKKNKDKEGD
jgi:predicted site-specific integrase-resolvase